MSGILSSRFNRRASFFHESPISFASASNSSFWGVPSLSITTAKMTREYEPVSFKYRRFSFSLKFSAKTLFKKTGLQKNKSGSISYLKGKDYKTPLHKRTFSYSCYWTGTGLQWKLMRGNINTKGYRMSFAFEKTPRISLGCKLDPAQYRD